MYATGISRSPEKLMSKLGLDSQSHFILFVSPVKPSDVEKISNRTKNEEMQRYHLWVFDSPPLVLPRLEEHLLDSRGCVDMGHTRCFSRGVKAIKFLSQK
ncbi:uncharacterized protein CTRU02_207391 [Colletotrichum truncatum]|uniref:Uncharacterized protein n=1 Tax=Colletotrichum truncatum TaxID=5467 RepID=A0ACC3Z0P2_COLTU|nr:uncharacterized protein CTRU02_00976 [Colletotrichum truncatum]KAF6800571.1 hypothetical protein CTRU02_00976 [Colletotrichum truncatum]